MLYLIRSRTRTRGINRIWNSVKIIISEIAMRVPELTW